MIRNPKRPNILFLPKIKEEDFTDTDDIFDNNFIQAIDDDPYSVSTVTVYDKMPKRFYNIKTWIRKTNLLCLNCSGNIKSVPIFICPCISFDENSNEYFEVRGNFCTFNCSVKYINTHFTEMEAIDLIAKQLLLYEKMYGIRLLKIPESLGRESLIEYGGDYTREEYEADILARNRDQILTKYKFEHFRQQGE